MVNRRSGLGLSLIIIALEYIFIQRNSARGDKIAGIQEDLVVSVPLYALRFE